MKFIKNDGGKKEAGYKGTSGDCVVRAITIATEKPYKEVYDALFALNQNQKGKLRGASPMDGGTKKATIRKYLDSIGWGFIPTMGIGTGCKVHLKENELPNGRLIVRVSKHLTAVINHTIQDLYNPDRDGTRCVYGYWKKNYMTTRIRDIARDLDARRIKNYIDRNSFRWSLENFDKNLAALETTLAKLKANDYTFCE